MWLADRLRKSAATAQNIVNDPNVPLVSIVIRSMDRPTLKRAMHSAAQQTWRNIEIIVVAACGDSHRSLVETFLGRPVRLVNIHRRLPRPEAANAGLEAAQGEWIGFLDDDDELLPQHFEGLLAAPRTRKERVVFSATRALDKKGKLLGHISHEGNHIQLYFHSRATVAATLVHRSLVEEGARFDPEFLVHEDHDFQVNCATRTEFLFVKQATCLWNAQAGDSGCGIGGTNDNPEQRIASVVKIRTKWAKFFERLLRNFDALLFAGQQYLKGGDIPAALECLERALALRPSDVNALNLCGMANMHAGHLERADKLLSSAAKRLPTNSAIRENLALVRKRRANAMESQ
jgi:glycosyltransferase involved in cell wall biosynthesis